MSDSIESMQFHDGWSIRDGSVEIAYLRRVDGYTKEMAQNVASIANRTAEYAYYEGIRDADEGTGLT